MLELCATRYAVFFSRRSQVCGHRVRCRGGKNTVGERQTSIVGLIWSGVVGYYMYQVS